MTRLPPKEQAYPSTLVSISLRCLPGWTQLTGNCERGERRSTFAASFDFATSFAFRAMAAPATVTAGRLVAGSRGVSASAAPAAAVTRGAIAVACRITIDASMGGHRVPPDRYGDSARVSGSCQTQPDSINEWVPSANSQGRRFSWIGALASQNLRPGLQRRNDLPPYVCICVVQLIAVYEGV